MVRLPFPVPRHTFGSPPTLLEVAQPPGRTSTRARAPAVLARETAVAVHISAGRVWVSGTSSNQEAEGLSRPVPSVAGTR